MSKNLYHRFRTLVLSTLILSLVLFNASIGFSAATPTKPAVKITWDANNPAPDGYRVYKRAEGQSYNYSQPAWSGSTIAGNVINLEWDTTYYFVVRAYVGTQVSADSNEVKYTTPQLDSDGDGVADANDAFPYDANRWLDSDGDDMGDNAGTDDPKAIANGQAGTSSTGNWSISGGAGSFGAQSLYSKEVGATYSFQSPIAGVYDVELWWTEYASRCTAVPVKIYDGTTLLETVVVNQQRDGGQWNFLGTYTFSGQARVVVVSTASGCSTNVDAVQFTKVATATADIVIDDGQPGTSSTGNWSISGGAGSFGAQSLYSKEVGATYSFQSPVAGDYDVELWWTEYASRCTAVPVKIYDGTTLLETVVVNQQRDGGQWNFLGTYTFSGQARVVVVSTASGCSTNVDAVKFTKVATAAADIVIDDGQPGTSAAGQWLVSGGSGSYGSQSLYSKEVGATYSFQSPITGVYDVEMWWTEYASRCTAVPVKIYDGTTLLETVVVNQQRDGGQWNFLGTYTFSGQARVVVVSTASGCSTNVDAVKIIKAANVVPTEVIVDDGQSGTTASGQWPVSGGADPYGSQSVYSKVVGARYSFASPVSGATDVDLWWTAYASRCTAVPVEIYDGTSLIDTVVVNQQQNGGQWNFIGTYKFGGQAKVVIVSEGSACSTNADAVRYTSY